MSAPKKTTRRPVVETLEGRLLLSAAPTDSPRNMPVLVSAPMGDRAESPPTQADKAGGDLAVTRPVPVEATRMSFAGASTTRVIQPAVMSSYQYTAVTIKNSTNVTLKYSFRWGNGAFASFTLTPNQQRVHFIRSQNQVATIAYDKSFSPGVQEQRYSLAGRNIVRKPGFYLVEPTPSVSEGKLYTFRGVSNGVQLYS